MKRVFVFLFLTVMILAGCRPNRLTSSTIPPTPTPAPRPKKTGQYCLAREELDQIMSKPTAFTCNRTKPKGNCDPACDGLPVPPDGRNCTTPCEREEIETGAEWVLAAENVEVAKIFVHPEKQLVLQEFCGYPEPNTRYYTWKCHPGSQPQWGSIYAYTLWRLHDPPYNRDLQNGDHFDVYIKRGLPDTAKFLCQDQAGAAAAGLTGLAASADQQAPGGMTVIVITLPGEAVQARWDYEGNALSIDLEESPPRAKLKSIDIPGATPSGFDVFVNLLKAFSPDENAHLYLVEKDLIPETGDLPDSVAYHRYSILQVIRPEGDDQGLQLGTLNPFPPTNPWFNYYLPESKPAIYLYPETRQSIKIQLNPQGQITTSLPAYPPGGWLLEANPGGTITYQTKSYPYLYYESNVTGYRQPARGFVIPTAQLEPFLRQSLPQTGLQNQELEDFLNYWLRRLQTRSEPYLLLSFLDQAVINQVDPLEVSPQPDTVIRVRVYFRPLPEPTTVPSQPLAPVPPRSGLTLVEWGGVLDTRKVPRYD